MIQRMRVQNFKALRDVTVPLGPFTVLVGPNDTGKSSFLEAVYALAESPNRPIGDCFWSAWEHTELIYLQNPESPVVLAADLVDSTGREKAVAYEMSLQFAPRHQCTVHTECIGPRIVGAKLPVRMQRGTNVTLCYQYRQQQLADSDQRELTAAACKRLHRPAVARWDVEELGRPSRLDPEQDDVPDPSGYGLPSCLATLKLYSEAAFEAIRHEFCQRFGEFADIRLKPARVSTWQRDGRFRRRGSGDGDGFALILVRKDGLEIPAELASGGVLVTLAFLTLLNQPKPRKLLLVEEPENGVHPGRLREIVETLRQTVESGDDRQVILTTHSPILLDWMKPEDVRVFLRDEQSDIKVYDLGQVPDVHDRLRYMMLGELVFNEGEQQLVREIEQHAGAVGG